MDEDLYLRKRRGGERNRLMYTHATQDEHTATEEDQRYAGTKVRSSSKPWHIHKAIDEQQQHQPGGGGRVAVWGGKVDSKLKSRKLTKWNGCGKSRGPK